MNAGREKEEETSNKMVVLNPIITIIISSVNRLDAPIKSQRFPALIIKQDPNIFYLQKITVIKTQESWK